MFRKKRRSSVGVGADCGVGLTSGEASGAGLTSVASSTFGAGAGFASGDGEGPAHDDKPCGLICADALHAETRIGRQSMTARQAARAFGVFLLISSSALSLSCGQPPCNDYT